MPSITELNNMDIDTLVKTLNRQAEKYNKQITRAKKRGTYARAKALNPYLKRLPMVTPRKIAEIKTHGPVAATSLIKAYLEREKMMAGGATQSNISKLEKKVDRITKALGVPKNGAAAIAPRLAKASESVKVRRSLYYEVLKAGVELGIYNSFADVDKPNIPSDKFEWYMRREVNKIRREAESYGENTVIPSYNELYDRISTDISETKYIIEMLL